MSGQAAYLGLIEEGPAIDVATLRLKVEGRKITEAEWVIAREGAVGEGGTSGPRQSTRVSRIADRHRQQLLRRVDGARRFDHHGPPRLYPQRERDAHRRSEPQSGRDPRKAQGKGKGLGGDCTSNLTNFSVALISARRYPVVDVEQQVVLGMGIFLRKPGVNQLRNLVNEWFFVEDGRIRNIWASMFYSTNDLPVPNGIRGPGRSRRRPSKTDSTIVVGT